MARTGDQSKELWRRIDEVEQLRHEQKQQRLAEVAEDADHGEHHAREVAVRVPDKDLGRIPVVRPQGGRDADEGKEQVQREHVRVRGRVRVRCEGGQKESVVDDEKERDHNGLRHFDAVDAGQDVDAVGAKDGDGCHVCVVCPACGSSVINTTKNIAHQMLTNIKQLAKIWLEPQRYHHLRDAEIDKIYNEHGN